MRGSSTGFKKRAFCGVSCRGGLTAREKIRTSVLQHEELSSANSHEILEDRREPPQHSPADTLAAAVGGPEQRTHGSCESINERCVSC